MSPRWCWHRALRQDQSTLRCLETRWRPGRLIGPCRWRQIRLGCSSRGMAPSQLQQRSLLLHAACSTQASAMQHEAAALTYTGGPSAVASSSLRPRQRAHQDVLERKSAVSRAVDARAALPCWIWPVCRGWSLSGPGTCVGQLIGLNPS